jgi:hypothetical protein
MRIPPLLAAAATVALAWGGRLPAAGPGAGRELTSDRPDATESPFTLEAGRLQLELDAVSVTRDRRDGGRTTEWVVAPFNLRYGLSADVEAGVFFVPHVRLTEQARNGSKTTVRGNGDTTLRAKWNLAGNDGGAVAYGVMADVKLPTAAAGLGNDQVEGTLILPVAFGLAGGCEGAAMTGVEWAQTDRGRRAIWVNTVTVGRELAPDLGGFLELTSAAGDGAHVATFNAGLTRQLGPELRLDAGFNLGLSRAAPDLTVFAGLVRRF